MSEVLHYPDDKVVDERPASIDEAVERLLVIVPKAVQEHVKNMKFDELIQAHHGLGRKIRNSFGLWQGNCPDGVHPDTYSGQITEAFWRRLQDDSH